MKDDVTAFTYSINTNGWVEFHNEVNKFDLYKEENVDGRRNSTNDDKILKFFESQANLGNLVIYSKDLYTNFEDKRIMARDTIHQCLKRLKRGGKIGKIKQGEYGLNEMGNSPKGEIKEGGKDE